MGVIELISFENEVFRAYAFWTAITVIKMIAMGPLTGKQRFKHKAFANPEDTKFEKKDATVKFGVEDIERVRRAHRNDLENCLPFMIIGLFYVLINPSAFIAINVFRLGAISRILHTVAYLNELQPWRAIGYLGCVIATVYMSIQVIMFSW